MGSCACAHAQASDSVEELWLGSNMMDSAAVVMLAEAVRVSRAPRRGRASSRDR
jgi:hypothetical protein